MDNQEKEWILKEAKEFFKENITKKHLNNTIKLSTLKEFNVNPFLMRYLAQFAFGKSDAISIAKSLIYPRVLGTSITTTFGTQIQLFCNETLKSYASTTTGIDIEFIDTKDNRRKWCQIKAGPNTINHDDIATIKNHFKAIKNLARTNRLNLQPTDCIVGILYGDRSSLSASYKAIDEDYPVYIGQEFWERLTGDKHFYLDLIKAFSSVARDMDASNILHQTIEKLASEIRSTYKIQ